MLSSAEAIGWHSQLRSHQLSQGLPGFYALSINPASATVDPTPAAGKEPIAEDPVLKGIAEGALSIVALVFAAFTFLYTTLITLAATDARTIALKRKLRHSLYATVVAILLSAILSVVAFASMKLKSPGMGFWAIGLAIVVLIDLCGIVVYMAADVFMEGQK
jgi:hypothetical protein